MNQYDYCRNSATLDEEQKRFANEAIWRKAREVTELFDKHGVRGNLYTGGSLALGQPTVEVRDGKTVGLKSDLDLFLLVESLQLTPSQKTFLVEVSRLDGEIEVSVHVQPAVRLREQLYSIAIDDLSQTLDRPLRQTFELPEGMSRVEFHPKTMALYMVNRLAMSMAPFYVATHAYANVPGDKIVRDSSTDVKTATVALRFLTYGRVPGRLNVSDLAVSAAEGHFQGVVDENTVLDLVRRREQYDSGASPLNLDMLELFRRVAAKDLGIESDSTAILSKAFVERYLAEANDRDVMHAFSLYLTCWAADPTEELRTLALAERASERFPSALLAAEVQRDLDILLAAHTPNTELVGPTMSSVANANMRAMTDGISRKIMEWYAQERS